MRFLLRLQLQDTEVDGYTRDTCSPDNSGTPCFDLMGRGVLEVPEERPYWAGYLWFLRRENRYTPKRNGSSCVSCYHDQSTPYRDGSECGEAPKAMFG